MQPLVVGGDPRGRGVVATANYVARRFGIHSAMSCAEALRRCPQAVFVRPRHTLYREYSRSVWDTVRGVVPTVEQTGLDEGYLDSAEVADDFLAARAVAEAVRTAVRAGTSLTCSLGVAPCKVVAKVASDARKPGGLVVVPPGREAAFLAPLACAPAARRRPQGRGAAAKRRDRDDRRPRCAHGRRSAPPAPRQRRHDAPRPRSRHRPARARARRRSGSRSASRTRSSATSPTASGSTTSCAAWPPRSRSPAAQRPGRAHGDDEAPLRRLLDPQPLDLARRPESTTPRTIADLACRLLDRGLRDRPGALRLVGVGVSGLADFRQLSLEAV